MHHPRYDEDVREPLLPEKCAEGTRAKQQQQQQQQDTFWPCAINLSKVITGAGMMAIPRAFLQIGWLPGTLMLVGVAVLTFFTLSVLVQGSAVTHASTYGELALRTCGRSMMRLLQLAVLMFCFGFSVVYLVVIRDILLGSPPACNGLLCEAFGPAAANIDERLLLIAVAVLVCAPLLTLRSMDKLASLNAAGVAASLLLGAVAVALAAVAAATGQAHPIPMMPQWNLLGHTRGEQLEALTDVIPVILACYVAHQSLHPLMPMLKPYSQGKMLKVVAAALGVSGSNFLLLSVGAAVAFGPATSINVLNNFSIDSLQPLLGWQLAATASWVVRGGYLLCILATLLLYMHPLRSCLAQMLWPEPHMNPTAPLTEAVATAGSSTCLLQQLLPSAASTSRQGCGPSSQRVQVHPAAAQAAVAVQAHTRILTAPQGSFACDLAGVTAIDLPPGTCQDDGAPSDSKVSTESRVTQQQSHQDAPQGLRGPPDATPQHQQQGYEEQQVQLQPDSGLEQLQVDCSSSGQRPMWQVLESATYFPLTYGLLAAMCLVAVLVTDIYQAVSAVGDIASTTQAFIVPGAVAIALVVQSRRRAKAAAAAVSVLQTPLACDVERACGASGFHGALGAVAGDADQSDVPVLTAGRGRLAALLARPSAVAVLYAAAGAGVLVLGLALFCNGVYERVSSAL